MYGGKEDLLLQNPIESSGTPMTSPSQSPTAEQNAETFLKISGQFKLGHLPTESQHPKTTRLSQMAIEDLDSAIETLRTVELEALTCLQTKQKAIDAMALAIKATLTQGGRIFFCGCGATGRLSLSLETLWREETRKRGLTGQQDAVISFMAGGDYALVKSIENFEDHPEFGERQLADLGFSPKDLLIATSEGGETPFVIGAAEAAARTTRPYFLFCNPKEQLAQTVERSKRIIENPQVTSVSLETGPMALAGSTRLQATTTLMLAVGAALFSNLPGEPDSAHIIEEFLQSLRAAPLQQLGKLIEREAEIYARNHYCVHETTDFAITVLTDTTERSPTFSLLAFEDSLDPQATCAWTYLIHASANSSEDSWQKILGREPRPLPWPEMREKFGRESLAAFDFSPVTRIRRSTRLGANHVHTYSTVRSGLQTIQLRLDDLLAEFPQPRSLLAEHLLVKIALNISSTLVMGRLGRFRGNLMLYVRAANNKLVDRAIRYVQILLKDEGRKDFSYDDICRTLFRVTRDLPSDQPAVLRTLEALLSPRGKANSDPSA